MYPNFSYLLKDLTGFWIPFPIQTFGLFVALAFVAAAQILKLELKRKETDGLVHSIFNKKGNSVSPYQQVGNIVFIAAISGIIGARLFSILEYPQDFFNDPFGTIFSTGGLTFYGGLIIGAIAVLIYAKRIDLKVVYLLDAAAPALMLAYAIGRIGCHLSGDGDWGIDNLAQKPSFFSFLPDWAWAYRYPHNVIETGIPMEGCTGKFCTILEIPVFPTALYEVIICFILFLILWISRKKIITPGILFCLYLIYNGIERFLIEQIRIDSSYSLFGILIKQAEIISTLFILTGLIGIFILKKHYQKKLT